MSTALSDEAIGTIAEAIFKKGPVTVVEAFSEFGQEARQFHCAEDIRVYVTGLRGTNNNPHFVVLYADMAGRLAWSRHATDPDKCDGHTYRYVAEGWGLIFVYLQISPTGNLESFVSANSEKRALAWQPTYPEMDAPGTWHWPAVARHSRRLARALKRAEIAQAGVAG